MCRDELIIKLRAEFNNHIRPIKINNQCEFCGSCDDLHLHHIDTFSNLLDETLEDLKINIYSENFTDSEVENINNIMLGKQLKSRFVTLCKNCHKEVHKDGYIKARDRLKPKTPKIINAEEIKILEEYLKGLIGKKLYKEEKEELINKINLRVDGHQQKSISKLNGYLEKLGIPYRIKSDKNKSTRYWIILIIDEEDDKLTKDINSLIDWFDNEWNKKRVSINDVRDELDIGVKSWQKVMDSSILNNYMKTNRITKTKIKGLGNTLYFKKY